jgi:hypothetical protein
MPLSPIRHPQAKVSQKDLPERCEFARYYMIRIEGGQLLRPAKAVPHSENKKRSSDICMNRGPSIAGRLQGGVEEAADNKNIVARRIRLVCTLSRIRKFKPAMNASASRGRESGAWHAAQLVRGPAAGATVIVE